MTPTSLVIKSPSCRLLSCQETIDANADGNVTFWEFARAVADGPAAHTLQNFVTRFRRSAFEQNLRKLEWMYS